MHRFRSFSRLPLIKWVSRLGLEKNGEPIKIPPCCTQASDLHAQEQSPFKLISPISQKTPCFSNSIDVKSAGAEKCSAASRHAGDGEEEDATVDALNGARRIPRRIAAAQDALMDYLHVTRGLSFSEAEHMSRRSPTFLGMLLEKTANEEEDIGKALTRFLRYHPINEFEPFFESIGLKPSEFEPLLPRDLLFLADAEMLLDNYRTLCNYGIARGNIGKIYRDAPEVFSCDCGVLRSKLQALEELGLSKTCVIKLVASSPVILIGDANAGFVEVLQWLDDIGIQRDWIAGVLSKRNTYDWRRMVEVLQFFGRLGFSKGSIGDLIRQHPDFMLNGSGKMVFMIAGIMLKVGASRKELFDLLSNFPNVVVGNFMKNLRKGILFLLEIGMSPEGIEKLLVSYPSVLGASSLKKPSSIFSNLNVGKRRLCKIIMEDPLQLERYTLGSKVSRLPHSGADRRPLKEKMKFLSRIGYVEESEDMKKALKVFRGKGDELQDRCDFLVKAGFDPKDVVNMIKIAPQVLNQKIDVLEEHDAQGSHFCRIHFRKVL